MTKTILIAALITAGASCPGLADMPGKNWISTAKVKAIMANRGHQITKIEADDGHWEGEARKANANFEFHVDPRTGAVTKLEHDHD